MPGRALVTFAGALDAIVIALGLALVNSSSGFFSWLPLVVGLAFAVPILAFAVRRRRLENAVEEARRMQTVDSTSTAAPAPADGPVSTSTDLIVIDEDGNFVVDDAATSPKAGSAGSAGGSSSATGKPTPPLIDEETKQRMADAKFESKNLRNTYMPRVEAAQRAAIAAAGGVVKAPYLKDDLRPTILSAMFSVLSVPVLSLFAIIALFALL